MEIFNSIKNFFGGLQKKPETNSGFSGITPEPKPLPADFFNLKKAPKVDVQKKLSEYGGSITKKVAEDPAASFLASVVQAIPRAAATLEKTASQKLGMEGISGTGVYKNKAVFGEEPVRTLGERTTKTEEDIKGLTGVDIGPIAAGGIAVGGTILDLIPGFGGGKKAVTESIETIAKSGKVDDIIPAIKSIFKEAKVTKTDDEVMALAAKYKDIDDVKAISDDLAQQVKPNTVKSGQNVAEEFGAKIKEGPTKKTFMDKVKEAPGNFTRNIISQFSPLDKLEKQILKGEKPNIPMSRRFEQIAGASGKAEADVRRLESEVIDGVKNEYDDFNTYLALKRSADRLATDPDLRKVGNYTIDQINDGIKYLEESIGPEKMLRFANSADNYQKIMDDMLRLQVDSGRISKAAYDAIKQENKFYAPFAVMKYVDEGGSLGGSNIATTDQIVKAIKGISDDTFELKDILQTSAEKIYKANILAEKNKALRDLAKLADREGANEFIKVVPLGSKPKAGKSVISFFENGTEKMLELPDDIAKTLNGLSKADMDVLTGFLSAAYKVMRAGATTGNIGFSVINLITDSISTALISKYGIRGVKDSAKFIAQFVDSLATAFAGNFKIPSKKLLEGYDEFLRSGAANSTYSTAIRPEAFKTTVGASKSKGIIGGTSKVLDTVSKFANSLEETGKILGLKRGMDIEKIASLQPEERAKILQKMVTEVRNYGGSPDFARRGQAAQSLNIMIPFFNARLQGTARDVSRLMGKDGAKEAAKTWTRISAAVGLPTVSLMAINLSDDNFEDYKQISKAERSNYWMIPNGNYFTDSAGNKVRDYIRIPKRNIMKPFANTIEDFMMFLKTKDPQQFAEMASEFASYLSPVNIEGKNINEVGMSVIGSINPLIKVPAEVVFNKNTYFKNDIVPQYLQGAEPREQYKVSTPGVYKKIGDILNISPLKLEQAVSGFTGGFANQFTIGKPEEGRSIATELPVLKRFARSGYVSTEDFESEIGKAKKEQVTASVQTKKKAQKLYNELKDLPKSEANALAKAVETTDPKTYEKLKEIVEDEKLGLTYKDKQIKSLGVENGQRAKFIYQQANKLKTREQKNTYIKDLESKKVITPKVRQQLTELIQEGSKGK